MKKFTNSFVFVLTEQDTIVLNIFQLTFYVNKYSDTPIMLHMYMCMCTYVWMYAYANGSVQQMSALKNKYTHAYIVPLCTINLFAHLKGG